MIAYIFKICQRYKVFITNFSKGDFYILFLNIEYKVVVSLLTDMLMLKIPVLI